MITTPAFITPQNRSFRYGDGIFETMKIRQNKIMLGDYHFNRISTSLSLLKIITPDFLNEEKLFNDISRLSALNNCQDNARIRVAIYRQEENNAGVVIEADPLNEEQDYLNENGWTIDIYPFARKSMDAFANLKSANYLPYVLADKYAKENGIDECLVLNSDNKIADASKANIFLVLKDKVHTPALNQGCVNGVKRRFVIEQIKNSGIAVHQHEINEDLLLQADEIFLTNAIIDIRWVKSFREKKFTNSFIKEFYKNNFTK